MNTVDLSNTKYGQTFATLIWIYEIQQKFHANNNRHQQDNKKPKKQQQQ